MKFRITEDEHIEYWYSEKDGGQVGGYLRDPADIVYFAADMGFEEKYQDHESDADHISSNIDAAYEFLEDWEGEEIEGMEWWHN